MPQNLNPEQKATNKLRWWEDLRTTGVLGAVVVSILELLHYLLPESPWNIIDQIVYGVLTVAGISFGSAAITRARHAKIVTEQNKQTELDFPPDDKN